jgi:basic membrane protein A
MLAVAKANPNVQFFCAVCDSTQLHANMGTWAGDYWKGQFLAGMLAGLMTKSNIVGWVTGFQFPPTVEGLNAFIAGAKMTNSNIRVLYSFAGSWYDPTKGAAAASTLIAQGADIVVGMGDGMTDGLVKQAASSGVHAIGYLYDEYSIAPNAIYSSTLWNSTAYFVSGIRAAMGGQIGYKSYTLDLYPDHIGYLAPYHGTVPDNVVSQLNTLFAKVYSGQLVEPYNTTLPAQG